MLIRALTSRPAERKGVILLVVISLLTLFAIVAISFLLYANAEANASRLFREAEANDISAAGISPDKLFTIFLQQLIYDAPDDNTGVYSALRGHSLARTIYGYYYPTTLYPTAQSNTIPFNGVGRLHTSAGSFMNPFGMDDYLLVNYTYFQKDPQLPPLGLADFLRDPERLGMRATLAMPVGEYTGGFNPPYTYPDLNNMFLAAMKADGTVLTQSFHRQWLFNLGNPTPFLLNDQKNPNWTNAQGKYLTLRPRPIDNNNDPQNSFPYPEDPGGDVRNLPPGLKGFLYIDPTTGMATYANNDSIWMDLGAPVMTDKHGKKFKPLFAPLILDLDGRINLNTAGNVRLNAGNSMLAPGHASNQGWGPWEVDVSQVLNNSGTGARPEWQNLFYGDPSVTYHGRYGVQGYPGSATSFQYGGDGVMPHFYSPVDYDGDDEKNGFVTSSRLLLPGDPLYALYGGGANSSFPLYNNLTTGLGGYGNNVQPPLPPNPPPTPLTPAEYNSNHYEGYLHPLLYNYFWPEANGSTNLAFGISNMEALLRFGDVNSSGLSDLFRLLPTNLQGTSQLPPPLTPGPTIPLIRNLVTTHSFDVAAPGITPWAIPPTLAGSPGMANYNLAPYAAGSPPPLPFGPAANFPSLVSRMPGQLTSGEFNGVDWRAISATLGRINLNRKLTPYATYDTTTGMWTPGNIQQADRDRQQFAADIFIRLVAAAGAYDLFNDNNKNPLTALPVTSPAQFDALRWLAQLSANIVDYIDSDDVMTTFNWTMPYNPMVPPGSYINYAYQNYPPQIQNALAQFQNALSAPPTGISADPIGQGWVFGTELPRLVINEGYAQFKTTPASTGGKPPAPPYTVQVDVWAELMNPFNAELTGADPANGVANLYNPTTGTSIYQIKLADTNSGNLRLNGNVNGDITMSAGDTVYTQPTPPAPSGNGGPCVLQFTPITIMGVPTPPPPVYGIGQTAPLGVTPGFFLVGSNATPPTSIVPNPSSSYIPPAGVGNPNPMSYQIPGATTPYPPPPPTILLQRLNNPYAAPNPPPGQPGNNPLFAPNVYVTVDYMEGGNLPPRPPNPGIVWTVTDTSTAGAAGGPSFGRMQPYTGAKTQIQQQQAPAPATTPNTFYGPNNPAPPATATSPYNWLPHLDRQLVSPMELLNVSAFKPHELTQQFNAQAYGTETQIPNPPAPGTTPCYYGHRAPWFDEDFATTGFTNSHFLYRFFEFLETGDRAAGVAPGGRFPGRMNLNTFYDQENLQALAAAQPAGTAGPDYFDQTVVQNIFNQLMTLRTPGLATGGDGFLHPPANSGVPLAPGVTPDQPFLSLAAGLSGVGGMPDPQYPSGLNINNTLMRWFAPMGGTPQPLFQVIGPPLSPTQVTHPYLQDQLFAKIFNNLTTRSNVFAVWLTVGFFEVTDSSTRPVKLGAEVGKAENRQVRHRMFAIIDRTSLATEANNPNTLMPPPVFVSGTDYGPPNPAVGAPVPIPTHPIPPPLLALLPANGPSISLPGAIPDTTKPGLPATMLAGTYDGMGWGIQAYQPSTTGFPIMGTNLLIDMGSNQELVNVLAIDQPGPPLGSPLGTPPPPPRVFLNGTMTPGLPNSLMAHAGPLAVTPVNTITVPASTPITPGSGPVTVTLNAVSGVFQGTPWSLQAPSGSQPGTTVVIDTGRIPPPGSPPVPGSQAELAIVQAVNQLGPGQYAVTLQAANPTGLFANAHPAPTSTVPAYTISYPIPVLGNPGPQSSLDPRQVPWVVRYLSIIN